MSTWLTRTWQGAHTISHQGNENRSDEILLLLSRMVKITKTNTNVGEDMEKINPHIMLVGV